MKRKREEGNGDSESPHGPLALLLAALLNALRVPALNVTDSASPGASIQRTYELTKYLEHQLRAVTGAYLSYLGPPFNDPDFSAPRPNSSEPSLPSATTRLDLWKGMGNLQRLSENQQAYSLLLRSVRGLAEGTLCPSLQRSLQHLCTGLQGLLISIAGVMSGLGYPLPPSAAPTGHLKPSVLLPRNLGDFSGFGEAPPLPGQARLFVRAASQRFLAQDGRFLGAEGTADVAVAVREGFQPLEKETDRAEEAELRLGAWLL
ncbi:cardiotrophin-like cytokine factor 1 [Huso huso]|uniref:Cardiotrophin-like cytokine factor 1 n=1 Tax=Huso huso TaxID=61971 RepID=A0ABR0Y7J4_HUSHU